MSVLQVFFKLIEKLTINFICYLIYSNTKRNQF